MKKRKIKLNKKRIDIIEFGIVILILAIYAYAETQNNSKDSSLKQETAYSKASFKFPDRINFSK